jgi:hypothetical protein
MLVSYRLVTLLKCIYSSIQVSDVLVLSVRCKLINFVSQIFPLFIPEMPAGSVPGAGLAIHTSC